MVDAITFIQLISFLPTISMCMTYDPKVPEGSTGITFLVGKFLVLNHFISAEYRKES